MPLPLFSSLAGKVGGERRAAGEGQNQGAPSLRSLTATDRAPPPNPKSRVESHGAGDQGGGQALKAGIQRCLLARYRRRPPPGGAWDQNEGKDAAAAAGDAEGRLGRSRQIAIFDGYLRYEDRNIVAKPRNDFERFLS